MKNTILLLILVLAICSCGDDATSTGLNIRIENRSEFDYKNIKVNTDADYNYEDLAPGELSDYQAHGLAYAYCYVEIDIDGSQYFIQPIDFVGETKLEDGDYTYILSANSDTTAIYGRLGIELRKD